MATESDVKEEIELNKKSNGDNDQTIEDSAHKLRWWYQVYLVHFGDINMAKQTFHMTTEVWMYRELSPMESKEYMADKNAFSPKFRILLNPLGTPEFDKDFWTFNNNKEFNVQRNEELDCFVVVTAMNFKASFFEALELESFPFDVQHFQMAVQFRFDVAMFDDINNTDNPLPLKPQFMVAKSFFTASDASCNLIGWIMKGIQVRPSVNGDVQCWVVVLRRAWRFYFWRVIVILSIVSLMSISVFVFGQDSVADRFGFLSTTLLTAVAYMFIINEYLPTLNYLTLLDYYVLFVVIFMFIIAVQIVVIELVHGQGKDDAQDLDFWMFIANLSGWFLIQAIFCVVSVVFYKEETKKIYVAKEDIDGYDLYSFPFYMIDFKKDQIIESKKMAEWVGPCYAHYETRTDW
eukprot:153202_1